MSDPTWLQEAWEAEVANRHEMGRVVAELLTYLSSLPDGPDIKPAGQSDMFLIDGVYCLVDIGEGLLKNLRKVLTKDTPA